MVRDLPAEEPTERSRDQRPKQGTERPRKRKCWKAFLDIWCFEYKARRKGIHGVLKEMVRLSEKERVEELAPEKDRRTNDCSGACCRMDDDEKELDRRHCSLCSFRDYPGDRGVSRGGRRARNKASARPGTSPWWLPRTTATGTPISKVPKGTRGA